MKKVALITGAAKGIGRQIALTLDQAGYHIAINYRGSIEHAHSLQTELSQPSKLYQCDVSDYDSVESMIKQIHQDFGHIDVLVNNAGITKDSLLLRMNPNDFNSVVNINLGGTFNTIKAMTPIFMRQKFGCIVNISSVIGVMGNIGQANYAASKAGIIGLTKSVAKEIASRNIRCNAIAPGFIETDMSDAINPSAKEKIMASIPLRRLGMPKDIADAVEFLVSDKATYITGQTLVIDGGLVNG